MKPTFLRLIGKVYRILVLLLLATFVSFIPKSHALLMPFLKDAGKGSPAHREAVQHLKSNDFDGVIRLADQILKKDPKDLKAYLFLTLAYLGKGDERKAAAQAGRVRDIAPGSEAQIYSSMGRFHALKKRPYKALTCFEEALRIQEDPDIMEETAALYLLRGQTEKAKVFYEKLLTVKPDYVNLSRIALSEKAYGDAISYAQKALDSDSRRENAYLVLGTSYLMTDRLELAKSNFLKLRELNPKWPLPDYYLGFVAFLQGRLDESLDHYSKIIRTPLRVKEVYLHQSIVWHLKGDLQKAGDSAQKAVDLDPGDPLGHLARGMIWLSAREARRADEAFSKAAGIFPDLALPDFRGSDLFSNLQASSLPYLTLSNLCLREGLFNKALESVDRAATDSENPFIMITRARAETRGRNGKRPSDLYPRIMERHPQLISPYVDLGDMAVSKGNIPGAIEHYERAMKIAPQLAGLHLTVGDLSNRLGQREKAASEYEKVIVLSPHSAMGYNQLAWTLAEKGQALDRALSYAKKGAALEPKNTQMKDTLGWIYYRSGRYNEAAKVYAGLSGQGVKHPAIYYHMGLVLEKLGKKNEAMESFERALDMTDAFSEAEDAKKKLRTLSGL